MMINNKRVNAIQQERTLERSHRRGLKTGFGVSSQKYLTDIKSQISTDVGGYNSSSSKVIETFDVKTTKSILLRQIVEKCTVRSSLRLGKDNNDCANEGDLVKIDNIRLKMLDEENLRQILMLRRDALKGFRIEGMEINNLISSILQDYSYVLYGGLPSGEEIVLKIPMEVESEFENKYCVDDLLIGHVSVIGVYKGIVTTDFITSNTFNYMATVGANKEEEGDSRVFNSSSSMQTVGAPVSTRKNGEYHFIDVIAVIQDITFFAPDVELPWYKRLGKLIKRV